METYRSTDARNEDRSLAVGLGWFSIALGATEMLAPEQLARFIGLPGNDRVTSTLRAFGAREIGNGIAILSNPQQAGWLWARVGGDALDVSYLASQMNAPGAERARIGAAIAALVGVAAADVRGASRLAAGESLARHGSRGDERREVLIERSITINRPIEEVYRFWRNLENLPRFMRHLESVEVLDERRSRWRATAPAGMKIEWEAEIVEEREPESIAWRSVDGSQIRNSGSVRFVRAPGARGTELHVQLRYEPPAGAVGRRLAWLFGREPDQQIRDDLRRVKQLLEVGEITVSEGPGLRRPAQPSPRPDKLRELAGATGVQR